MACHKIAFPLLFLFLSFFFACAPDTVTSSWALPVMPDDKPLVSASPPESSPILPIPYRSISAPSAAPPLKGIKGGYWPTWLKSTFPPSAIDTSYFTHIFYAFLPIDTSSYQLVVTRDDESMLSIFTSTLHSHLPPLKALLSIGGADAGPETFALMASNSSTRAAFIASTVSVARKYGLDGLDLDWEFPANADEMANLGRLFEEWGAALSEEEKATGRPRLLLTAAVYFASNFFLSAVSRSYPAASISKNLDWVNVMCYDFHGSWDTSATGAHAALYDPTSQISTSYGIQSWINAGVPREKVVMGLPLYGRTWELKDPGVNGIGAPAVGVGPGNRGAIRFTLLVDFNKANNATVIYDETTVSTYSYAGTSWIGYDDATSVDQKVKFAKEHRLGGYFFWALGYDKEWTISSQASSTWEY